MIVLSNLNLFQILEILAMENVQPCFILIYTGRSFQGIVMLQIHLVTLNACVSVSVQVEVC